MPIALDRAVFGRTPQGDLVEAFTLRNASGICLRLMTLGGVILSLRTPDRSGVADDIVLGFDRLDDYLTRSPYFGAIIGRYANRIARGRFTLDGAEHVLAINDGVHHLHGGASGFDKVNWCATPVDGEAFTGVELTHTSPHGAEGYPGTLQVRVRYELADDDTLTVRYEASADRATPVNLTQHTYFNLAGPMADTVLGHELRIHADAFLPVDSTLIPTGALAPVEGTPFDFRRAATIGSRIDAPHPQLRHAGGYDHTFVLDAPEPGAAADGAGLPAVAAWVHEPQSGRTLTVHTSEPGLQFYSGNFLDGTLHGKGGRVYARRGGFCLEPHHFPDSPNRPEFPTTVLRPGARYRSRTVYAFGVAT